MRLQPHGGKDNKGQRYQYGEGGGESGEKPCLNNSLQLRQGQKTMGLLTGIEGVGRGIACRNHMRAFPTSRKDGKPQNSGTDSYFFQIGTINPHGINRRFLFN